MGVLPPSLLFFILIPLVYSTTTIRCYSCITPWNGANFDQLCTDKTFCEGLWCTKGPDERSSGILHGCSNIVPLDNAASNCKAVNGSGSNYFNCYCRNIEYCNTSALSTVSFTLLLTLIVIKQW